MFQTQVEMLKNPNISRLTPMMQQYFEVKSEHQDYLLFYRMGDFYELFFEDAVIASQVLDIVLTKRGKHQELDIPMCGVPAHSSEYYLDKLLKAGYKVAVCEQLETPEEARKRGYKAVVRREVIRIVTPGTISEDRLLDPKSANFLAAVAAHESKNAIAWLDPTTGEFYFANTSVGSLSADLTMLSPKEVIIADKVYEEPHYFNQLGDFKRIVTTRASVVFDYQRCLRRLLNFYNLSSLEGVIGSSNKAEISACGALLEYIEHTYKSNLPRLSMPQRHENTNFLQIDPSTRRSLEITSGLTDRGNCLLKVIDATQTSSGARLLNQYLAAPLSNSIMINKRLDAVEFFVKHQDLRTGLVSCLKSYPDVERALSKVFIKKAGPRDLDHIKAGLNIALDIANSLLFFEHGLPELVSSNVRQIGNFGDTLEILDMALAKDAPYQLREGAFVKPGYSPRLDELYSFKENSQGELDKLRDKYRAQTGINALKVSYNNIIGYFIEITPSQLQKLPENLFIHKQTLGSSVRYKSDELGIMEEKILSCEESIRVVEEEIFNSLCDKIINSAEFISKAAQAISFLDVISSLAETAFKRNYVRPEVDQSKRFEIIKGRHPVVEQKVKEQFVANSCELSTKSIWLITGPNMAGKSTFLRQNALICIMAQMGSFVPAEQASIGVIDRLFSRIGSGDDISSGQSTFMVEMIETAFIINNATDRSLIILDEVGRGTATYDGLSIAWAIIENIHNTIKAKTLFATHYHELTDLEGMLPLLECHTMDVNEWEGKVMFLHRVKRGKADRSYGIHVAELAGMPKDVTLRANQILASLEGKEKPVIKISPAGANEGAVDEEILKSFRELDADALTPRDALDFIYQLKQKIR